MVLKLWQARSVITVRKFVLARLAVGSQKGTALTGFSVLSYFLDRRPFQVLIIVSARRSLLVLTNILARVRMMVRTNSKAREVNTVHIRKMAHSAFQVLIPWWFASKVGFSNLARLARSGRFAEICWLALARWFSTNSMALITVGFSIDKWITRFLRFTVSRRLAVDSGFSSLRWLANVTRFTFQLWLASH